MSTGRCRRLAVPLAPNGHLEILHPPSRRPPLAECSIVYFVFRRLPVVSPAHNRIFRAEQASHQLCPNSRVVIDAAVSSAGQPSDHASMQSAFTCLPDNTRYWKHERAAARFDQPLSDQYPSKCRRGTIDLPAFSRSIRQPRSARADVRRAASTGSSLQHAASPRVVSTRYQPARSLQTLPRCRA